jgi:DNA-binding transcriptional MocR family regulator
LPSEFDEAAVAERARAAGVGVYPLGSYCARSRPDRASALVLGYGEVTPAQAEHGVQLLAHAVHASSRKL